MTPLKTQNPTELHALSHLQMDAMPLYRAAAVAVHLADLGVTQQVGGG